MRLDDFRGLVRRLADEVPEEYYAGIAEVVVSPRAVPHPTRGGIFTLGECVPLPGSPAGEIQSRVVLYHGSFAALAHDDPAFDWVGEARETLQHELRHHLEWKAGAPELEALDQAAEANYARHDGEPFDPLFFLDGDEPVPGVHQVEDDWFLDHVVRGPVREVRFLWHGRTYVAPVPEGVAPPAYLLVTEGVANPPPGDLVLVLRRKPSLLDLFRPRPLAQARVAARRVPDDPAPAPTR